MSTIFFRHGYRQILESLLLLFVYLVKKLNCADFHMIFL